MNPVGPTTTARSDAPRPLARWALAPALVAPVAMIGGWTVAAALEPGFDAASGTISALATHQVDQPWVMTLGLAATGVAHLGTATALRSVGRVGRTLLALGGAATVAVAALPVDTSPRPHAIAAGVAFAALTLWPLGASGPRPRGAERDLPLVRPGTRVVAATGMAILLGWFVAELQAGGASIGLAERALAGAQSLWPLAVVLGLRRR